MSGKIKQLLRGLLLTTVTLTGVYASEPATEMVAFPSYQMQPAIKSQETEFYYNITRNKNILSLDGGGMRGLISALMLQKIEKDVSEIVGQKVKIGQLFDFVVGTSTGAISALSLTAPDKVDSTEPRYSAHDLVELYNTDAPKIFKRSWWRQIRSLFGLIDEKYSRDNLDKLLRNRLDNTTVDQAVTNVCVTSYEITDQEEGSTPVVFRSYDVGDQLRSDITAVDAAEASGAAPTYFEPKEIIIDGKPHYFIDGGMTGQNNPVCRAILEAFAVTVRQEQNSKSDDKTLFGDFFIISLGTGEKPARYDPEKFNNGGMLNLVKPVIDIALDAPSQTNHEMMLFLENVMQTNNYYRLNPKLKQDIQLDDTSPTALNHMRLLTEKYMEDEEKTFNKIAKRLAFSYLHRNQNNLTPNVYETYLAMFNEYQEERDVYLEDQKDLHRLKAWKLEMERNHLSDLKFKLHAARPAEDFYHSAPSTARSGSSTTTNRLNSPRDEYEFAS